jgi:phosphatidate cytidylyltransferase
MISFSRNCVNRCFFGTVITILVGYFIAYSHQIPYLFVGGIALALTLTLREFSSICEKRGHILATSVLIPFSILYLVSRYFAIVHPQTVNFPYLVLFLTSIAITLAYLERQDGAIANVGLTIFSFLYVTLPFSWLIDINFLPKCTSGLPTSFWLVFVLCTTKGSDITAYVVGKSIGKHLLAPKLSPNKTVEGAVFGVVGSLLIATLLPHFWPVALPAALSTSSWLSLGLFMGLAALLGDLTESLLKRDAKLKDSSSLPGLGGVLDITDSLTFAVPLLYIYLNVTGRLS